MLARTGTFRHVPKVIVLSLWHRLQAAHRMFYAAQIISRDGPLHLVWIASYLESRLKKGDVEKVNIPWSVEQVEEFVGSHPLALRYTGPMLYGIVRIHDRKVKYLLQDANHAQAQLRALGTPGKIEHMHAAVVDLPADANKAPFGAITLLDDEALLLGNTSDAQIGRLPSGQFLRAMSATLLFGGGQVRAGIVDDVSALSCCLCHTSQVADWHVLCLCVTSALRWMVFSSSTCNQGLCTEMCIVQCTADRPHNTAFHHQCDCSSLVQCS